MRQRNYQVGIEEVTVVMLSLQFINWAEHPDFIRLLQICFARSKKQWQDLLMHYDAFKEECRKSFDAKNVSKHKPERPEGQEKIPIKKYQIEDIKKWLFNLKETEAIDVPFYSSISSDGKAFSEFKEDDFLILDYWIKKMLQKLARNKRRKKIRNTTHGEIDLRYLMRNRFSKGDELAQLFYRITKKEQSKIVFLCDVSKSMDLYSVFVASLVRQLRVIFDHCAIYFFNTELYQIEFEEDWREMKGLWMGGTRIGYCFGQWLEQIPVWFDKRSKILIYSDGWDTGELELLDTSMFTLQMISDKVLWLNPTIKDATDLHISGMKVASAYIDNLAAVYDLNTLREFVREL